MANKEFKRLSINEAIEKLKDDDVEVRKIAVISLEGIRNEIVINPLIDAMADENTIIRYKAAENLGNMGEIVVNPLIERLTTLEGEAKRFAFFALKGTKSKKAIDYFIDNLNDDDFGVRKIAVRSLGELKVIETIDKISKFMIEDEDWGVRLAAVRSLGDMETEEAIDPLKKARRIEKDKDFKKAVNKSIKKIEKTIK